MDSEIRKKFFKIPFGLLSGVSTCLTSIIFLLTIAIVKHFNLFELTRNLLTLGSILSLALDGLLIYYELALSKVRKLYPKSQQEIIIVPHKSSAPLFGLCFAEGLVESYLVMSCLDYGISLFSAFFVLTSARIFGSLLIGWFSDYIGTKATLIFCIFALLLSLLTVQFPQSFGLIPNAKLAYKILAMKGFFGCIFVLIKREMIISATVKIEGETTHERL